MSTNGATPIECRSLSAGYGTMAVVHDLDLHVDKGEIVALLGANGAGKTTTLLTLAGELPPLAGEVLLDGEVTQAPMHRRCREGLSFLTEERSVFMELTTRENLRLADVDQSVALELFPELERHMKTTAGLLSGGQQQMLSLARALGRKPSVLLADELSLGLAPLVVQRLLSSIRQAADTTGVAVLLVEQHVRQALRVADRVVVMDRGRISISGPVDEVRDQIEAIESAYLSAAP